MIQTVYSIIGDLAPTQYINRPDLGTSNIVISYHFFNESFENYGDGKGMCQGGTLQVDVFSTVDYYTVVAQIKQRLIGNNFRFSGSYDSNDSVGTTNLYHKVILFNYTESEVKNV